MTVAAEPYALDSAYAGVRVRMTYKAARSGIGMPVAIPGRRHESGRVSPCISSLDPVGIDMTLNAGRVRTLNIVARHAALDVSPGQVRMEAAASPAPYHHKLCPQVRLRPEFELIDVSACRMASRAEVPGFMTCCAIRHLRRS